MKLKAFEAYGIEAEYMIVDKKSLKVKNEVEYCLTKLNGGELTDEVELGKTSVSNELVTHVIELKCNGPQKNLEEIEKDFNRVLKEINTLLEDKEATLMGTAIHPLMNPDTEMHLWPHGQKDIYAKYNEIFNCKGHGWSNLQSVHINLPYSTEEEFGRLHAAIRLILPLFPYLCASSPVVEGKFSEFPDQRLKFYEKNQSKIPSITGDVVPEMAFTFEEYQNVLKKLYTDIAPYDPKGILQHQWLNSRGAIVKFDVGAIEIRLMDIQESPKQDFSLISFFVETLKSLYQEEFISYEDQKKISEKDLFKVYIDANSYDVKNLPKFYADVFKTDAKNYKSLVESIYQHVKNKMPSRYQEGFEYILKEGNASIRIKKFLRANDLQKLMLKLTEVVKDNERF